MQTEAGTYIRQYLAHYPNELDNTNSNIYECCFCYILHHGSGMPGHGVPYYITIKNLHPTNLPLPENKKGEHIYANVPGMAQVTIEQDELSLGTFSIPLAQFGYVELRNGSIFKKQTSHMTFHPATGAVVKQSTDVE